MDNLLLLSIIASEAADEERECQVVPQRSPQRGDQLRRPVRERERSETDDAVVPNPSNFEAASVPDSDATDCEFYDSRPRTQGHLAPAPSPFFSEDVEEEDEPEAEDASPLEPPPRIRSCYDLEEVHIDILEPELIPNHEMVNHFILTRSDQEVFGRILTYGFLSALITQRGWKLWLTELMYGYLKYVVQTGMHPWTFKPLELNPEIFRRLVVHDKIAMLKTDRTKAIPLRRETIETYDLLGIFVTTGRSGALSTTISFEMEQGDGTVDTSFILGTHFASDMVMSGHRGFPLLSLANQTGDLGVMEKVGRFSSQLQRIREMWTDTPHMHFQLDFENSNRLFDLWYLKNMADTFESKVHVTPALFDFVRECVPLFANAFDPTHNQEHCRLHYDCTPCSEALFESMDEGSKKRRIQVDVVTIVFTDEEDPEYSGTCVALPFIHQL